LLYHHTRFLSGIRQGALGALPQIRVRHHVAPVRLVKVLSLVVFGEHLVKDV
jgi:hypothetical protein